MRSTTMAISNITFPAVTVRKAGSEEVDGLSDTLSVAFLADPVMSWCYPDPDRRRRILPDVFRAIVTATLPHGGIDTVPGEHAGAVWVPPEAELDEEQLVGELLDVSGDSAGRVLTMLELVDAEHPGDVPHQYLFLLGTRPEWQSHGLGSTLLRAVLDPCDEDGTPAYLEASSERNKQLYLRHGFEVRTTLRLPDGPPVWCMWREPRR
jgi:GNAT superfamily N-acetyltransferase